MLPAAGDVLDRATRACLSSTESYKQMILGGPLGCLFLSAVFGARNCSICVLSSGQSRLTKSKVLQILFAGDLWPTQDINTSCEQNRKDKMYVVCVIGPGGKALRRRMLAHVSQRLRTCTFQHKVRAPHIYIYIYIHTYIHVCIYIYMYIHIYIYIYT